MRISINIECDNCKSHASFETKKTYAEFEGRIYEDYSSIVEGVGDNQFFSASQSQPDMINIKCLICGKKHELIT